MALNDQLLLNSAIDQLEDLVLIASEATLRNGFGCMDSKGQQEITTALLNLLKFTDRSQEGLVLADQLAEMSDFLFLLSNLIQRQFIEVVNSNQVSKVHPFTMAHSCLTSWTSESASFRKQLCNLSSQLMWTLVTELRVLQLAMQSDNNELWHLAETTLCIVCNCAQEVTCHKTLVGMQCQQVALPYCTSPKLQVNFAAKCIVGSLSYLLDPAYLQMMELDMHEVNMLRLALIVAIKDEKHMVTLETSGSRITYSALELTKALVDLVRNEKNGAAFSTLEVCESLFILLQSSTSSEQQAANKLLRKLLAMPASQLDVQGIQQVLDRFQLFPNEEDVFSSPGGINFENVQVQGDLFTNTDKVMVNLKWIQRAVIDGIKSSKVLNHVADSDHFELVHGLIQLSSFFLEHWCIRAHGQCRTAADSLLKPNTFFGLLQDYIAQHFAVFLKEEINLHHFHPLLIVLHCLLLWTYCSCSVRRELGSSGILLQLVKQLRVISEIPAWTQCHFRLVEMLLFILANCAIEHSCHEYLYFLECVNTILPFCKCSDFCIRIGAKRILCSLNDNLSCYQKQFIHLSDEEYTGLLEAFIKAPNQATYTIKIKSNKRNVVYSALELTIILCGLVRNETNKANIAASGIMSAAMKLLCEGTILEQEAAAELFWALNCTHSELSSQISGNLINCIPVEATKHVAVMLFGATLEKEPIAHGMSIKHEDFIEDEELNELRHIIFEAMDGMWSCRVPINSVQIAAPLNVSEIYMRTDDIASIFHHLSQFFFTADKKLCKAGVKCVCDSLGFLSLTKATCHELYFGIAEKGATKQDVYCLLLVSQCLLQMMDHDGVIKKVLGSTGFLFELLLQLKVLELSFALPEKSYQIGLSALSVIANCMSETSCHTYVLQGDLLKNSIHTYCASQNNDISMNAKLVASSLAYLLPSSYIQLFRLSAKELEVFLDSMGTMASLQLSEAPKQWEGEFSVSEQLQICILLSQNEDNRLNFAMHPVVYVAISNVLREGAASEQTKACELLWKLSTKSLPLPDLPTSDEAPKNKSQKKKQIRKELDYLAADGLVADADIIAVIESECPVLKCILQDLIRIGNEDVKVVASCVTLALTGNISSITMTSKDALMYAQGCYQYRKYAECIQLASLYTDSSDDTTKLRAKTVKGRALYYLYLRELKLLSKASLSPREFVAASDPCFQKAKQAISALSLTMSLGKDIQGICNEEDEKKLDFILLDYIQTSNDPNLQHCILCHGRKKLMKSHIWPRSVLKLLVKFKCIEPPQTGKIFSASWKGYGNLFGPRELIFSLLCHDCEELLSASCEQAFVSEFFERLYDTQDREKLSEEMYIKYSDKLYRFCLSILFRALPITRPSVTSFGNSDDIYKIFSLCRQYLLKEEVPSSTSLPAVAILMLPTALPPKSRHSSFIKHILHSAGISVISTLSLISGQTSVLGRGRFFLGSVGIVSILVSLDSMSRLPVPPECIIDPNGGTYHVQSDVRRFHRLPMGMWLELDKLARNYEANILQVPVGVAQHPKSQEWIREDFKHLDLAALKRTATTKQTNIRYLPKGFFLENEIAADALSLPSTHHLIVHMYVHTSEEENVLLILAVGTEAPYSIQSPYVIIQLSAPNYTISLGYFISKSNFTIESPLIGSDNKELLPLIEAEFGTKKIVNRELPKLMKKKGFLSWKSFFFRIDRELFPVYDTKCSLSQGCWYCSGRCINCMKKTSFDSVPMIGYHDTSVDCRSCSINCYRYYGSGLAISIELGFQPSQLSNGHHRVLSFCTSMVNSNLEKSKILVSLFLCNNSHDYPADKPYALFQQRHLGGAQRFLEFFVSNDGFEPTDLLPYIDKNEENQLHLDSLKNSEFSAILNAIASHFSHRTLLSLLTAVVENPKAFPATLKIPCFTRNFNYLPPGYSVSHNEKVVLPSNHYILLHNTIEYDRLHEGSVLFLVADSTGDSFMPYVLHYEYSDYYTFAVAYTVDLDSLEPSAPIIGTQLIHNENFRSEMLTMGLKAVMTKLSKLLQKHDVQSICALQSKIRTVSGTSTVSSRCDRRLDCWYCQYLCDNCPTTAKFGFKHTKLQVCSQECKFNIDQQL